MKAIQQYELDSVSGGQLVWHPMLSTLENLGSRMDDEWAESLDRVSLLVAEAPPANPIQICPINDPDAYTSS